MSYSRPCGQFNVPKPGFTLSETLVSMGAASLLMVGLGSSVYVASKVVNSPERTSQQVVKASQGLDQMAAELHYAVTFLERSPRAVGFTVADRNGDGVAETIRYSWSGAEGEPVMRQYNGAPVTAALPSVHDFKLNYHLQTITEEADESEIQPASEGLALEFDGWANVSSPTSTNASLNAGSWYSVYFELAWPEGATSFEVTRVQLKMRRTGTTGQFSIAMHAPSAGVNSPPAVASLGTATTYSSNTLATTVDWKEFPITGVVLTPGSGYCLVAKGLATGAQIQYLRSTSGPANSTALRYSLNSGSSWTPSIASQYNQYDAPVRIYGVFSGAASEPTPPVERQFVRAVHLATQQTAEAESRIETAIDILNAPEVVSP